MKTIKKKLVIFIKYLLCVDGIKFNFKNIFFHLYIMSFTPFVWCFVIKCLDLKYLKDSKLSVGEEYWFSCLMVFMMAMIYVSNAKIIYFTNNAGLQCERKQVKLHGLEEQREKPLEYLFSMILPFVAFDVFDWVNEIILGVLFVVIGYVVHKNKIAIGSINTMSMGIKFYEFELIDENGKKLIIKGMAPFDARKALGYEINMYKVSEDFVFVSLL